MVPEQIGAGAGGVLAHPVVAGDQQAAATPAAEGGAADAQGVAEDGGVQPLSAAA